MQVWLSSKAGHLSLMLCSPKPDDPGSITAQEICLFYQAHSMEHWLSTGE